MKRTLIISLVSLTLLVGCRGHNIEPGPPIKPCASRPEMCTMDYTPVCAKRAIEPEWKTYSNECNACSDPNVEGTREGECD